ncbi:High potential iron-sulfur protein [Nitrosomonas aestuarii]|uniref:High-potential iron-sulfur protein n=1 Tax=Nitrosomonas aestuarii TaxID=52441 RepID=A0A1I4GXM1_9PROT|nr:high-potential iron-sulfur protein [Nitrosomonas aestuarii]SFL34193.1 High potential iron-sulfur protein [Nitrosomonas aestuarii]
MSYRYKKLTRRRFIKFTVFGATIPFLGGVIDEVEASKASKAVMKYQGSPNGNEKCSNCIQFIPGKKSQANGKCKVVEGSISPQGWCTAYASES